MEGPKINSVGAVKLKNIPISGRDTRVLLFYAFETEIKCFTIINHEDAKRMVLLNKISKRNYLFSDKHTKDEN